jgi:predicted ATPase/DNA-binding CsgD family transcriptional regulator
VPIHSLPNQPTPFVGRLTELDDIATLLARPTCRLLTLVGLGGIGKTRLALEAAQFQGVMFPDGIEFIALQPLSSPDLVIAAVADALRIQFYPSGEPKDQLLNYLQQKTLLLVVDNFEHLLAGAALLSEILDAAPGVKMLVTSREALKLREEWVFEVGGLSFPATESDRELERYGAVQLFLQHAQRVSSGFGLSDFDKPGLARICQIVAGMPLALELAAVWVRTLSCLEIAQEIERGLDILETPTRNIPARHRNMRAVLDHSWGLLSETEQAVFMKLSVFRGGFARPAAEGVANASLPILAALLNKSLLRRTPDGRYDIHELLRQYGDEQLTRSGSKDMTQAAHSTYYTEFLHQQEQDIKGRRQVTALNEVEVDFENIRTAWQCALRRKNYYALDLALESLFYFCEMRGRLLEGRELLWAAQEQLAVETDPELQSIWGRILVRSLWVGRWSQDDFNWVETTKVQAEISLTIARQQGDKPQTAFCLWLLGVLGHQTKDTAAGIPFLEESLALFTELDDRFYMARAADWLGAVYGSSGQREKFVTLSEQSLNWRRAIGDRFGVSASLMNLIGAASDRGQYELAKQYAHEMGRIYQEINSGDWMVRQTAILSRIAFQQGDFQETRRYAEETLQLTSRSGLVALDAKETALAALSMLAALEEDYTGSWQLCEQAMSKVRPGNTFLDEGLAVAACGLGNYAIAQPILLIALRQAFDSQDQNEMTGVLPIATILLADQHQPEQAVELLGLAFHHPASASAWLEQWPLLTRLRVQLEAELGSEAFGAAWERGKIRDLVMTVERLLRHFQPDEPQQTVQSSNSRLVEPLTERELEILHHIAQGLSNAEIAEQLVIEVSTVKKHINRLYDKMGAKTRTHALVRAKALHLL